jgi:hypothetical protein
MSSPPEADAERKSGSIPMRQTIAAEAVAMTGRGEPGVWDMHLATAGEITEFRGPF